MTKVIKGTFEYEIHITDSSYELKASPKMEDELASLIVVNMLAGYSKDNLLKSIENAKGKQINIFQDRLGKLNSTQSIIGLMGSDYVRELTLITDKNPADETLPTEEPIMGLEDVIKLNNGK